MLLSPRGGGSFAEAAPLSGRASLVLPLASAAGWRADGGIYTCGRNIQRFLSARAYPIATEGVFAPSSRVSPFDSVFAPPSRVEPPWAVGARLEKSSNKRACRDDQQPVCAGDSLLSKVETKVACARLVEQECEIDSQAWFFIPTVTAPATVRTGKNR